MTPVPSARALTVLATQLATGAGDLIRAHRQDHFAVDTKSTPTDMVTEVDRAAEAYIRRELARQRPDDAVLGEEAGRRSGSSGVRWFVDPIDGTVNFVLGLPQYAVSIAAQVDGRVVAACVHNPVSRELFHATLGSGAFAGERGRRRSSQRFCRALPTSAASARPRSICARSPPGGSTRTSRQG